MTPRNRRDKLRDIQQIADSLRADLPTGPDGGDAPDFTEAILDRVHAQRPFLSHRTRRLVVACRYAAAAAVLLMIAGIVVVQATSPKVTSIAAPIQPVTFSPAVDSVRDMTAQAVSNVRRAIREINTLTDPSAQAFVRQAATDLSAETGEGVANQLTARPRVATPDQAHYTLATYSTTGTLPIDDNNPSMYYGTMGGAYGNIAASAGSVRTNGLMARSRFVYLPEPYSLRPVARSECSLLDDFPLIITGQPACDGFVPQ